MTPGPPVSPAEWRERARAFAARTVQPRADEIETSDALPRDLVEALVRDGYFGLGQPAAWGGGGEGSEALVSVLEELAYASPAVATLLSVHLAVCAAPIAEWGTDAQREKFLRPLLQQGRLGAFALTEPGAGSDAARIACRYRKEGEGFRLDGSKMFITNGGLADLLLVFATRDPGEGHAGISAFLVPQGTPGLSVAQRWEKLGLRGSETTELTLHEVALGKDSLLGPEGKGLAIALGALTGGRVGIAATALGVARAALEALTEAARAAPADWKSAVVARAFAEVAAASALVQRAARQKDLGEPFAEEASAAKLLASRVAVSIASRAVDVVGEPSGPAAARAARIFRDARVFPIVEGTSEIQELILGRELLGQ